MKLIDVTTDGLLDRIKATEYNGADLDQLRNDLVDVIEALRNELHGTIANHVGNYHASEA